MTEVLPTSNWASSMSILRAMRDWLCQTRWKVLAVSHRRHFCGPLWLPKPRLCQINTPGHNVFCIFCTFWLLFSFLPPSLHLSKSAALQFCPTLPFIAPFLPHTSPRPESIMIFRGMVAPKGGALAMECAPIWTQGISLTLGLVGLPHPESGKGKLLHGFSVLS